MMNRIVRPAGLLLLSAFALFGQNITSSVVGTVVDPGGSVVPSAEVKLVNTGTTAASNTTADASGFFRITNLFAGTYNLTVSAKGFKALNVNNIALGSSETRDLGRLTLTLGEVTESISVTSEVAAVQTASSERAALVDGNQLNALAIKGRDMMSYMRTLPGVVDTNNGRDAAGGSILGGLTFSGNTGIIGMAVDGATDIDTGCSNCFAHFEPNIDSIAEIKVLVSNFAAEYGRNSGAQISITTKGGTQEFHGSGWWTHRHENFNANQFFNNQTGIQVPRYRFNIAGWSLGGPVYVPKYFNTNKTKLFFFASQEYTNQLVNFATQTRTMPTAAERAGDFSQTIDQGGSLVRIIDPTSGAQFPNNVIPASRINGWGQSILNFFPLPNNTFGPGTQFYRAANFQTGGSGAHPRRNDIIRFDVNATSKLNGFFRYGHDFDDQDQLFKGIQFLKGVQTHPNPGTGYVATVNYTFSPTLVNQATYNFSYNYFAYFAKNPAEVARSLANGATGTAQSGQALPSLFPLHPIGPGPGGDMLSGPCQCSNGYGSFFPNVNFGGSPILNSPSYSPGDIDYVNTNRIKQFSDNLTWVKDSHSVKFGIYAEYNRKLQPGNINYIGSYNFGNDSSNPLNTGHGFANALLGNFTTYSERTGHFVYDTRYWNTEFYAQDDWRIGKRLTINYGIRFYHVSPQIDLLQEFAYLDPAKFDRNQVPRFYTPFCSNGAANCSGANRVGIDRQTGRQVPAANIGLFVPNSGNTANGMVVAGKDGNPYDTYTNAYLVGAPRIGFALDVFGNGKTAIRGGWGAFYDRLDGNQVYGMSGQPPIGYEPTVYYSNISNLAGAGGLFGPSTVTQWAGKSPIPQNRTASLGIQSNIGFGTVIDISYQGTYGLNRPFRVNLNPVPLGSEFNNYIDSTQAINTATGQFRNLPTALERPKFPGWGDINSLQFGAKSRYDGLQTSVRRRLQNGLLFSAAYTWSHSFAVTSFDPLVGNNYNRNWGPQGSDRRHLANITYAYDIPSVGKKLHQKYVGWVTDGWNLSGITTFSSGSPFTPSYTTTNNLNISGTASSNARIDVVGDPFKDIPAGNANLPHGKYFFNPAAFALPAVGTLGNAGVNIMYGPGYANYDMTLRREFRLGQNERRAIQMRLEAFNVFNHTQFTGVNSAFTFTPVSASNPLGAYRNTNANIGAMTGERGPRILSLELRVRF